MSCPICNKELRFGSKFCSYVCYGIAQRKRIKRICEICESEFDVPRSHAEKGARTCSRKCHFQYQAIRPQISGEKHHAWQGGRTRNKKGYVLIKKPDHPTKHKTNNVFEHRIVMEALLGYVLDPQLVVHHIDGNTTNNNPNNLAIMTRSAHTRLHNILKKGRSE